MSYFGDYDDSETISMINMINDTGDFDTSDESIYVGGRAYIKQSPIAKVINTTPNYNIFMTENPIAKVVNNTTPNYNIFITTADDGTIFKKPMSASTSGVRIL